MSGIATFFALTIVAILQLSLAPLFPLSIAQADLGLVFVAWITLFRGPRTAMWVAPVLAVMTGLLSDRSPGLFMLAYLPIVPLIAFLRPRDTNMIFGGYWRALGAVVVVGVWGRVILALAAIAQGAEPAVGVLIGSIIAPGIFLDGALLTLAFAPARLVGWDVASMALTRGGFAAYEHS